MNNANTKPARMSIKTWRTLHAHVNYIELADGAKVCTDCGAVVK